MNKKAILINFFIFCCLFNSQLFADGSFQVPLPPDGKVIDADKPNRIIKHYSVSMDEIVAFYKTALQDQTEIKWQHKEADKSIKIFDWGNQKWHKITITQENGYVSVLVNKDSWTWITGTLIIRFIGVFIVLIILMISLYISGSIMSSVDKKPKVHPNKV